MRSSYHKTKHWNIFFVSWCSYQVSSSIPPPKTIWQLLVAESDHNQESHNQENNNAGLANEDVNYSTNSEPLDALIQAWTQ